MVRSGPCPSNALMLTMMFLQYNCDFDYECKQQNGDLYQHCWDKDRGY